jgi:hypothetical protein
MCDAAIVRLRYNRTHSPLSFQADGIRNGSAGDQARVKRVRAWRLDTSAHELQDAGAWQSEMFCRNLRTIPAFRKFAPRSASRARPPPCLCRNGARSSPGGQEIGSILTLEVDVGVNTLGGRRVPRRSRRSGASGGFQLCSYLRRCVGCVGLFAQGKWRTVGLPVGREDSCGHLRAAILIAFLAMLGSSPSLRAEPRVRVSAHRKKGSSGRTENDGG